MVGITHERSYVTNVFLFEKRTLFFPVKPLSMNEAEKTVKNVKAFEAFTRNTKGIECAIDLEYILSHKINDQILR